MVELANGMVCVVISILITPHTPDQHLQAASLLWITSQLSRLMAKVCSQYSHGSF